MHRNKIEKYAFEKGFWKGLGAPIGLFIDTRTRSQPSDYKIINLPNRARGTTTDDWMTVGHDLLDAIHKLTD